jgi:hypothetical protein
MVHGAAMPVGEMKHYPGKTTFFLVLVSILAASGGLMFGYDVGISGAQNLPSKSSIVTFCILTIFVFCVLDSYKCYTLICLLLLVY